MTHDPVPLNPSDPYHTKRVGNREAWLKNHRDREDILAAEEAAKIQAVWDKKFAVQEQAYYAGRPYVRHTSIIGEMIRLEPQRNMHDKRGPRHNEDL